MQCKSNSHKTSSALGLPMTGPLFFFFFLSNPLARDLPTNWLFRFWGKPWVGPGLGNVLLCAG